MLKTINGEIDFENERYLLNHALLDASVLIPNSPDAQTILKIICDRLIKSSHYTGSKQKLDTCNL